MSKKEDVCLLMKRSFELDIQLKDGYGYALEAVREAAYDLENVEATDDAELVRQFAKKLESRRDKVQAKMDKLDQRFRSRYGNDPALQDIDWDDYCGEFDWWLS